MTTVPDGSASVQSAPQLMPGGVDVTVPEPTTVTVSVRGAFCVNVAVQLRSCVIWTVAPHPAPDHPPNVKPAAGDVTSVTFVRRP